MPIERIKPEPFPAADRIEALKELFPEAFADGAVDWAALRDLASSIPSEDEEETAEHFGLFWPGKREARRLAGKPAEGTLIPCPGEGVDEDKTSNVFIEGENLEVLKLLRKSYKGMVKMIYIDPPYNTGNDFVYDDNFTEPLEDYLRRTGQIDGEGRPLTTNKKSDGRFHSKWLSMMYPRLRLARDLLRDDGVIFVSIDDNEVQHLRMLMNEVFGEENFIAQITWKARVKPVNIGDAKYRPQCEIEYVLCYQRTQIEGKFLPLYSGSVRSYPYKLDNRDYRLATILKSNRGANFRTTMSFSINDYAPPEGQRWQAGHDEIQSLWQSGHIEIKNGTPFRRYFADEENAEHDPFYCFMDNESSSTSEAGKLILNSILGEHHGFDTVKPVQLLKTLIRSIINPDANEIILDFFVGSGTTCHAILELVAEDHKKRKYIAVQIPEPLDINNKSQKTSAEYCDSLNKPRDITEIGKERIRRVIKKLKAEKAQELSAEDEAPDLGFKVFKLARSNFKPWKDYHGDDIAAIESLFEDAVTPLASGWKDHPDALFTEILLLEGYPLDSAVKARKEFGANLIREVSCPQHEKRLLVCLDEAIHPETVRALELRSDEIFVCLDSAIDDSTKARLDDKGMIKTI